MAQGGCKVRADFFFFFLEQMLQEKLHSDSAVQVEDRPSSRVKLIS